MATVEALGRYPGVTAPPQAAPTREGWSVELLPAGRSLASPRSFLNDKALGWALITGAILVLSYLRPWYVKLPGGNSQICLFHAVTGIPCLLCGMTRSLAAAARLQIGESFYLHLLGPFLFLFVVLAFLGSTALLVTGRRLELSVPGSARKTIFWFVLALFAAAWILKLLAFGANV